MECDPCSKRFEYKPRKCSAKLNCKRRFYRDDSDVIRCGLGILNFENCTFTDKYTAQDEEYRCFNFNGSFTKSLEHDTTTGSLKNDADYKELVTALARNNLHLLSEVPLAFGTEYPLVNPTASFAAVALGVPQCNLSLPKPPTLSSKTSAAEMVELYCEAFTRDVPFCEYGTSTEIAKVLGTDRLNDPDVLTYFPDQSGVAFTPETVFRIPFHGCSAGPYVSQLLLLNIPVSNMVNVQKYLSYEPRYPASGRSEWGVNAEEMIKIQNGQISSLPGPIALDTEAKFIFSGRALAETVHNDAIYQFYYQAANILMGLEVPLNPTIPKYQNQVPFVTAGGPPAIICAIAKCAQLALEHAWYWKWRRYRRLRPEVYSLWIDNVKSGRVANTDNYDIDSIILNNGILEDVKEINDMWLGTDEGGYTLPQCFMEGSPVHPSYPAGHSTVAGACSTILKIFFDSDKSWASIPGVMSGSLTGGIMGVVEASADGSTLKTYSGSTTALTVATEINKLGQNVATGRNIAGVHYFTDGRNGMLLGQEIAVRYMSDCLSLTAENYTSGEPPRVKFRDFEGKNRYIIPTICKSKS